MESVVIVVQVQAMYDLTVEEAHTFAVGEGVWVVHNCPSDGVAEALTRDFAHSGSIESINNIVNSGLSESAAKTLSRGGVCQPSGQFLYSGGYT